MYTSLCLFHHGKGVFHIHTYLVLGTPAYSATSQWKEASTFFPDAPSYSRWREWEKSTCRYSLCPQGNNTEMAQCGACVYICCVYCIVHVCAVCATCVVCVQVYVCPWCYRVHASVCVWEETATIFNNDRMASLPVVILPSAIIHTVHRRIKIKSKCHPQISNLHWFGHQWIMCCSLLNLRNIVDWTFTILSIILIISVCMLSVHQGLVLTDVSCCVLGIIILSLKKISVCLHTVCIHCRYVLVVHNSCMRVHVRAHMLNVILVHFLLKWCCLGVLYRAHRTHQKKVQSQYRYRRTQYQSSTQ